MASVRDSLIRITLLKIGSAARNVRLCHGWIVADHLSEVGNRSIKMALLEVGLPPIVGRLQEFRIQTKCGRVVGNCFVVSAQI